MDGQCISTSRAFTASGQKWHVRHCQVRGAICKIRYLAYDRKSKERKVEEKSFQRRTHTNVASGGTAVSDREVGSQKEQKNQELHAMAGQQTRCAE